MNAGHRVRVFRTFLSRKEFPRFSSRCERFRKRRFSLPLHVNGEEGEVFFPRGNKLPFLMYALALSACTARRGFFFSFFLSFVEGKADKRVLILFSRRKSPECSTRILLPII